MLAVVLLWILALSGCTFMVACGEVDSDEQLIKSESMSCPVNMENEKRAA